MDNIWFDVVPEGDCDAAERQVKKTKQNKKPSKEKETKPNADRYPKNRKVDMDLFSIDDDVNSDD